MRQIVSGLAGTVGIFFYARFINPADLGAASLAILVYEGLVLLIRGRAFDSPTFQKFALYSIPVPIIANELGWISAEVGRQPWIVQGLMRTNEAFSKVVPAGSGSVTTTDCAALGPFCVKPSVYVSSRPAKTGSGAALLSTARSAAGSPGPSRVR